MAGDQSNDERRRIDYIMDSLNTMTQETNAFAIVISHLRKVSDGKNHEEGARVRLSDLRGSGSIGQVAHTVLAVERNQQSGEGQTTLRVLKCRWTGNTGEADNISYDKNTGRLLPISFEPVIEEEQNDY